jgi:hypothetical protein
MFTAGRISPAVSSSEENDTVSLENVVNDEDRTKSRVDV